MTFDLALRLTEVLLAVALIQRGAEDVRHGPGLFGTQILCGAALICGLWPAIVVLWGLGLVQLARFRGPYNGGSDKMVLLVMTCVMAAHLVPALAEVALAYLAVQLVLSYAVSGWVKLRNPDWRDGTALREVFAFSIYPNSEDLRALSQRPLLMRGASLGVIGFELAMPLALLSQGTLWAALGVAALFHLSNGLLLGLNRFVWAWLAAFPALIWFQAHLLG
ncbi:HTTM domain-containing protein [Gymnodinialimonas sp. 57CJ19]|uniref:HTTM domain-containing protein n=1 Tax=Gymnodinialimonas sp. 57CJ19 TaxID=3138498 RepID=UPI00313424F6